MRKRTRERLEHEAEAGVAGALTGATCGAIAGPIGAMAGAVIGSAIGALAAVVIDKNVADQDARDAELDRVIGVSGGELGAPNLEHPPAKRGTYSGASAGVATGGGEDAAEGPMQVPSS